LNQLLFFKIKDEGSDDEEGNDSAEESKSVIEEVWRPRVLSKYEKKKQKRMEADKKRMKKSNKAKTVAEDVSVVEDRKTKAAAVSLSRILTDKDFAKIEAAQVKKQLLYSKSQAKRRADDDITDTNKRYFKILLIWYFVYSYYYN